MIDFMATGELEFCKRKKVSPEGGVIADVIIARGTMTSPLEKEIFLKTTK